MAVIKFFTNNIAIVGGSGIGAYGSSFGNSVAVGEYQQTTFITNSAGTAQGPQGNNVKFLNAQSGIVGSSTSGINLLAIPNAQSTFEIRFEHDTAVKTQNVQIRTYDRNNINNAYSGVVVKIAEIRHPDPVQNPNGSGSTTWVSWDNSSGVLNLVSSPGSGGQAANGGGGHLDTVHSWYIALSLSPNSIGSKLGATYFSTEWL